jgi:LEA14-like dessication related protein
MRSIFCTVRRLVLVYSILFAGFSFLASCSKPEAPEYLGFRDFALESLSMDSSSLHTELVFYNPNPFSMELKRGDVNVFLNDKLANHYVMDSTINIPTKDTFYVPLNLKVSPKLLISSALSMLMNNNKIKVRIAGSVRVKRSGVSFNVPINYEVMQSIQ